MTIVAWVLLTSLVLLVAFRPGTSFAFYWTVMPIQVLIYYATGNQGGFARITVVLLVLIGFVATCLRDQPFHWRRASIDWFWAGMLAWMAMSYMWSPSTEYGAFKIGQWVWLAVAAFVGPRLFIYGLKQLHDFLFGLVIAGGVMTLAALWLYFTGQMRLESVERFEIFGTNTLAMARIEYATALGGLYLMVRGPRLVRVIGGIITPVAIWVAILTGSRGPFYSAIVAAFVMVLFMRGAKRVWMVVAMTLAGIVFMYALLAIVPEGPLKRILKTTEMSFAESDRYPLFMTALQQGIDSGGLGGGVGSFPYYSNSGQEFHDYAHNLFLEAWGELGVVGVILVVGILTVGVKRIITLYRRGRDDPRLRTATGFIAGMGAFGFFQSMTTADLPEQSWLWLAIGLASLPLEHEPNELPAIDSGYQPEMPAIG